MSRDSPLSFVAVSFHFYVFMHCHHYFWLFMYQEWLVVREEYSYKLCGILCLLQTGGTADTLILESCSRGRSRDCGPGDHWELGAPLSHVSKMCVSVAPSPVGGFWLPSGSWCQPSMALGGQLSSPSLLQRQETANWVIVKFCLSERQEHIILTPTGSLRDYKITGL